MKLHRIQATYDRRATTYDRSIGRIERWLLGDLRREFGAALRGETLEAAIGSGLNLVHYSPAVTRAIGVDLSRGMLDQARARSIATGRSLILVQADAARLPFGDASFDTVAISLALCTVPDPVATLLELARVCRPAGQIILLEHVRSPYRAIALGQGAITPLQERLIGCHLTRETIALARHLGFVIESERRRLFDIFRLVVAHPPQGAINPTHSRGKS